MRLLPGILLLTALCTCAPPVEHPAAEVSRDIVIRTELLVGERQDLMEGDIVPLRLTIENPMKRTCVILSRLSPALSHEKGITWQDADAGTLSYYKNEDSFRLYRDTDSPTPEVFNRGLIPPGKSLSITFKIRLIDMPRHFELKYYPLPIDAIARSVYFQSHAAAGFVDYRKLPKQEVESMLLVDEKNNKTQMEEAGIREKIRMVLFQPTFLDKYAVSLITVDRPIRRRPFSLNEAARTVGARPTDPHTYSSLMRSWIVRHRDALWMVDERGNARIPSMDFAVFLLIDSLSSDAAIEIEIDMTVPSSFTERQKIVVVEKGTRNVPLLLIDAGEMKNFLVGIHSHQLTLDALPDRDRWHLVLKKVPDLQPK